MNLNEAIYTKTFFLSLTLLYFVVSAKDYESFDMGDGENHLKSEREVWKLREDGRGEEKKTPKNQ